MVKMSYSKWVKVTTERKQWFEYLLKICPLDIFAFFVPLWRMSNTFRLTHKIFLVVFPPNNRLSQSNYNRGKQTVFFFFQLWKWSTA